MQGILVTLEILTVSFSFAPVGRPHWYLVGGDIRSSGGLGVTASLRLLFPETDGRIGVLSGLLSSILDWDPLTSSPDITQGLGLAGVDAKKQRKWNGTIKFLQKIARTAPCKSGRCAPLVNEMRDPKGPQERYVIRDLLADYDKLPRPVMKDSQNVTVHFAASLMELLNHAEATGRVGMRMIMRLWWKDPQLAWEPRQYAGVEKVSLPPNLIWTPDIGLYNGVNTQFDQQKTKLALYSTGDIIWTPEVEAGVTCAYHFRSDAWQCPLVFRSYAYEADALDLVPEMDENGNVRIGTQELDNTGPWILLTNSGKRELLKYDLPPTEFMGIRYELTTRSKIGHHSSKGKYNGRG